MLSNCSVPPFERIITLQPMRAFNSHFNNCSRSFAEHVESYRTSTATPFGQNCRKPSTVLAKTDTEKNSPIAVPSFLKRLTLSSRSTFISSPTHVHTILTCLSPKSHTPLYRPNHSSIHSILCFFSSLILNHLTLRFSISSSSTDCSSLSLFSYSSTVVLYNFSLFSLKYRTNKVKHR